MVPGFLAPFKGGRNVRVGQGRGRGQGPKELFNTRHSQLRNVIERSFGVLKQQFAYLRGSGSIFIYANANQCRYCMLCTSQFS